MGEALRLGYDAVVEALEAHGAARPDAARGGMDLGKLWALPSSEIVMGERLGRAASGRFCGRGASRLYAGGGGGVGRSDAVGVPLGRCSDAGL